MKVLLLDRIANLGDLGDEVNVKNGYARNFLIPHRLAWRATDENRVHFEKLREELKQKAIEKLEGAEKRAAQLEDKTLTILMRVAESDRLYGSVGPNEVVSELASDGIEIHKSEVRMPEGVIRNTGEFEIEIQVHPEVSRTITLIVQPE